MHGNLSEQSNGRVALVTGATSGFGLAITRRLVKDGYRVVAAGRRRERLGAVGDELGESVLPFPLDVTDPAAVAALLETVPSAWRAIDILVNNAGLALGLEPAPRADIQHWDTMIATNVTGLVHVTRAILPGMVARNRGLRADLVGTNVRVTNLEPGLVGGTEFSQVRFGGDQAKADAVYTGTQPLTAEDVANTVAWVAGLPEHVNINRIEMMPTCQASGPFAIKRS